MRAIRLVSLVAAVGLAASVAQAQTKWDMPTAYPVANFHSVNAQKFADAVKGRASFPVSAADAIHGAAVFEAIMRSAASGQPVAVA